MKDELLPDYDQANKFFDALTGSTDKPITFQLFTDDKKLIPIGKDGKKGKDPRATHLHVKRGSVYADLHKKQKEFCGIYAMVNSGDGKGRSNKNVVKVNALFIDLDGSPWEPAATALKPHMRVESSRGRWHLYWLVKDCDLDQFKPIQQAIARKYDGDKSCCDLSRVLRVPGFFHLKKEPVMTMLTEINDFPRYSIQQVIDGLKLELSAPAKSPTRNLKEIQEQSLPACSFGYTYTNPKTGEMTDLKAWAVANPDFDIVAAINRKFAMGPVAEGKQHIICPFADEHTDTSPDQATFIANADTHHPSFAIRCMHSHCADRDRLEFLQVMFQDGWLPADKVILPPLPPKRVQKIYYPAGEISSILQLQALSPDEFRVLLHLMHLAWAAEDGTLPDDNWMISRSLGMEESLWEKYRMTFIRSGWLDVRDGRLTNNIFSREFSNAQNAFDSYRERGRRGGKNSRSRTS